MVSLTPYGQSLFDALVAGRLTMSDEEFSDLLFDLYQAGAKAYTLENGDALALLRERLDDIRRLSMLVEALGHAR